MPLDASSTGYPKLRCGHEPGRPRASWLGVLVASGARDANRCFCIRDGRDKDWGRRLRSSLATWPGSPTTAWSHAGVRGGGYGARAERDVDKRSIAISTLGRGSLDHAIGAGDLERIPLGLGWRVDRLVEAELRHRLAETRKVEAATAEVEARSDLVALEERKLSERSRTRGLHAALVGGTAGLADPVRSRLHRRRR